MSCMDDLTLSHHHALRYHPMPARSSPHRLIVALDVPNLGAARRLVMRLDDRVSFYKIGLELLFAGGLDFAVELKSQGKRVFLDLKFLDIGHTVERAVSQAANLGVDFLTVHGQDRKTLRAAVAGRGAYPLKLLAVSVLTNLTEADLAEQGSALTPSDLAAHRAEMAFAEGFDGVVASGQEAARLRAVTGPGFLIATPGIRLPGGVAGDQARMTTPDQALAAGADYLVVGRPITAADDPAAAAEMFVEHMARTETGLTRTSG